MKMEARLRSTRMAWLAGMVALCAPLASVAAMPPPVVVPVVVIADDPETQAAGEALVTVLRELGWFARGPTIDRAAFEECLRSKANREACIRKSRGWKQNKAAVVVLAEGTPVQTWTCIGTAAAPRSQERQRASFELREALFGDSSKRFEIRNKASSCIMAAGSESGW